MFKIAAVLSVCMVVFAGCATMPLEEKQRRQSIPAPAPFGFYHKVQKGQTLWRISGLYGIDIDELMKYNNLKEGAALEIGQPILIPKASSAVLAISPSSIARAPSSAPVVPEDFIWPMKGKVIASFGQIVDDIPAKGIDIQPRGNADVVAVRTGKVVFYKDNFGIFGRTVIIDHGDGFSSVYARASDVFVKPGDIVQRGMRIARISSRGGAYLHFQIRKAHLAQNPYYFLP